MSPALVAAILGGLAAGGAVAWGAGRAWRWYRGRLARHPRPLTIRVRAEGEVVRVVMEGPGVVLNLAPEKAMALGIAIKRAAMQAAEERP